MGKTSSTKTSSTRGKNPTTLQTEELEKIARLLISKWSHEEIADYFFLEPTKGVLFHLFLP